MLQYEKLSSNKYFLFAVPTLTLLLLSLYFYPEWLKLPPSYTHQWAQSDWYAMSLCYAKESLNFFLPRTYALNTHFVEISKWGAGITRADFPIHAYIVALIMYGSENFEPIVFRTYTLIYGLVGMFFLFKLVYSSSKSIYWSLCCMIIAMCSPVYAYYQVGFQPVVNSFSNFIISIYFIFNYIKNRKESYFYLGLSFITLAALSRPSFAIYWIALFLFHVWFSFRAKKHVYIHYLAFLLSLALQLGSYYYNVWVKKEYGAMFIDFALPATSWESYAKFISDAWATWKFDYLSESQYIMLGILIVTSICLGFSNEKKGENTILAFGLLLISLAGALSFTFLMATQFPDHDYYAIDVLMPVLVLFFLVFAELIASQRQSLPLSLGVLFACIFFNVAECKSVLNRRMEPNSENVYENVRKQYLGSGALMEKLKIPKDARLLILNSYTYNIPLVEMERKGYPILVMDSHTIQKSMTYSYDYAVIRNEDIGHLMSLYPLIITKLQKVGSNNSITIYKRSKNESGTILSFYNVNPDKILQMDTSNFNTGKKPKIWNCQYQEVTKIESFSKPYSLKVDSHLIGPKMEFVNIKNIDEYKSLNFILKAKLLSQDADKNIKLAYEIHYADHKTFEFTDILTEATANSKWLNASCTAKLKLSNNKNIKKVVLFLWNPSKMVYFIDDIETYVYAD